MLIYTVVSAPNYDQLLHNEDESYNSYNLQISDNIMIKDIGMADRNVWVEKITSFLFEWFLCLCHPYIPKHRFYSFSFHHLSAPNLPGS